MSKGRPRKSIEAHKRDGTYREDRHGKETRIESKPDKPLWLSPQAETLWDIEFDRLCGHWVLYPGDSYLLGQFFEACAVAVLARRSMYPEDPRDESIGLHGAVVAKPNNFTGEMELKKHPGITAWKDAVEMMRKIGSEFERRGSERPDPPSNEPKPDDPPPVQRKT